MKYVIVEKMCMEVPIIFPDNILHDTFKDMKPISAGKFEIAYDGKNHKFIFEAYGDSKSLNLKPRPEDKDIIQHAFEFKG